MSQQNVLFILIIYLQETVEAAHQTERDDLMKEKQEVETERDGLRDHHTKLLMAEQAGRNIYLCSR